MSNPIMKVRLYAHTIAYQYDNIPADPLLSEEENNDIMKELLSLSITDEEKEQIVNSLSFHKRDGLIEAFYPDSLGTVTGKWWIDDEFSRLP